jgi:hypothetical protein
VVNLDVRESILTPAAADELRQVFGSHPMRVVHSRPHDLAAWRPGHESDHQEETTEYWPWLLLAAVLVFTTETVLANFYTRRRRVQSPPETEYRGSRRTETIQPPRELRGSRSLQEV